MAQTALITLTTAGADTGPFDLYSDIDGYSVPFETGVSKASLVAGYTSTLIPNGATIVRVKSDNVLCTNYIDLYLVPTTTTTTSSTSTTSTSSTTTTTTTAAPLTVTIDACGSQQADPSGNVLIYAYASFPVATTLTVGVTWTASDTSTISGTVTILAGETCGTTTLVADPNETGANLEITSITPGSFDNQTYVEGVETLADVCTTCPIP
jgi:hypothetical protein